MKQLKITRELALPVDAATQTFAFLGRRGSGKTYGAGVLVEHLLDASVQVVVLDTVGNWYGLRLGIDGKTAAYDIPVLGGLRGDIPIDENAGGLIADALIDAGRSAVIDISQFSLSARQRFATAFGERLWKGKKSEQMPTPMHLVIEEAQLIIPQNVKPDQGRMVGIFEEIVRLGRNYGIGASMLSQRPQSVNKEVLNQAECLFVFQTNGSQERDALKKWVVAQGADVDLVQSLPSLPIGTAYAWSPQWLQTFQKVTFVGKVTYDASSTPKVGKQRPAARALAQLNLEDLKAKMQEVVERAEADDPKRLRKRILELNAALDKRTVELDLAKRAPALKPVPQEQVDQLFAIAKEHEALTKRLAHLVVQFGKVSKQVGGYVVQVPAGVPANGIRVISSPAIPKGEAVISNGKQHQRVTNIADGEKLPDGERKILTAAAQYGFGTSRDGLSILTGYKRSTRDTYIHRLKLKNLVFEDSGNIIATPAGVAALGPDFERLPTGHALLLHWLGKLPEGERKVLQVLVDAHGEPLPRPAITEQTGYKRSTRDTYLYRLRLRRLVEFDGAGVRASAELFG